MEKDKQTKLNRLKDLAEILDSKKSGTTELVLLKKINDLKDELSKLQELLGVVENKATEKTGEVLNTLNETYSALESKIADLSKQDLKLSKDTQYAENYFKNELATIKNTISNLKLQHGKDGKDADEVDTEELALEASNRALEAIKPLIPIVPTSDEIIAQIPVIGEKVRDSLELLQGEERLDASAIKNLPKTIENGVKYYGGSGIKEVIAGSGISVDNTNLGYPIVSAPGSTTDEKVKYDAGDPTAGYVADKFVAGTGITLSEGTGADENKLKITNSGVVTETDPLSLHLDQTTPQTFTGGTVTGTGLLQVVGGVLGKNVMITVSATAPANPQMGDLWVDLTE